MAKPQKVLIQILLLFILEREKRHYGIHNQGSEPETKDRGRRYIPHGYGEDVDFKPHPQSVDPRYTE